MMKAVPWVALLVLAGILALQWHDWPPGSLPALPSPDSDQVSAGPTPLAPDLLARVEAWEDKGAYAEVIERPLFLPDRRPPEEDAGQDQALTEVESASLDGLDLTAVIMTPDETVAWVLDQAKQGLVKLRTGEDVAGWKVQEIRKDRLLLERQGETNTLLLRIYSAPSIPPRPQRQGPPRRSTPPAAD